MATLNVDQEAIAWMFHQYHRGPSRRGVFPRSPNQWLVHFEIDDITRHATGIEQNNQIVFNHVLLGDPQTCPLCNET